MLSLPGDCLINGGLEDRVPGVSLEPWGATMMRLDAEPERSLLSLRAGLLDLTPESDDAELLYFKVVVCFFSSIFYFINFKNLSYILNRSKFQYLI